MDAHTPTSVKSPELTPALSSVPHRKEALEMKPLKPHINSNVARGLMALKIHEVIKEAHKHMCMLTVPIC